MILSSCVWNETESYTNYLPLDDSEYPYANLPRIVIETEDFHEIRDKETDIPAKLQIWGKDAPESEVIDLKVKGRGTSSFKAMPKYGIRLSLTNKRKMLGMPAEKDWVLIANFADKSMLKNYAVHRLSDWLDANYTPRSKFVELYFNRSYQGVYLLTETIDVSKNRVNIKNLPGAYLLEKTSKTESNKKFITTQNGNLFQIRYSADSSPQKILQHLDSLESLLNNSKELANKIDQWLSMEDFFRFYWIQEFSKNSDGAFHRSVYMTYVNGCPIKFGPIWDFDMSLGGRFHSNSKSTPFGWMTKNAGWFKPILQNKEIWAAAVSYWSKNHHHFENFIDSLDFYAEVIRNATNNNFKRWDILDNTEFWAYDESYKDYDEALDSLKSWIKQRIEWIDENI